MLEFSLVLFEIRKPFRVVGSDGLPAAPTLELRGEALDPRGMVAARRSFPSLACFICMASSESDAKWK